MAWVRLDDQFTDHPKVAGLTNDAFCLHVTAMCWTAKQQTDGKLPSRLLSRLAWRCQDPAIAAAELVTAGLWDVDPVDGWEIHDYGEYNPTKAQSDELAGKRSEAGKAGAMARWQNHSKPDGKSHGKHDGKPYGKIMPPSPSPSPIQRDEGLARPPASPPPPSQEPADPEYGAALSKLESLGMITGTALLEFQSVWPDLRNGRRAWIDDAVAVAHANSANSPVYAIRVLANSVKTGKRPGETPQPAHRSKGGVTKAEMDAIFGVDIHGNPV